MSVRVLGAAASLTLPQVRIVNVQAAFLATNSTPFAGQAHIIGASAVLAETSTPSTIATLRIFGLSATYVGTSFSKARILGASGALVNVASMTTSARIIGLSAKMTPSGSTQMYVRVNGRAVPCRIAIRKGGVAKAVGLHTYTPDRFPLVTDDLLTTFNHTTWDWNRYTGPRKPVRNLRPYSGTLYLDGSRRSVDGYYITGGGVRSDNAQNAQPVPATVSNVHVEGGGLYIQARPQDHLDVSYYRNTRNAADTSPQDAVGGRGPLTMRYSDLTAANDALTNRTSKHGPTNVSYCRIWGTGYNSHPTLHEDGMQWVAGSTPGDAYATTTLGQKEYRSVFYRNRVGRFTNSNIIIQAMGKSTGLAPGENDRPPHDILIEENYFAYQKSLEQSSGKYPNRHIFCIPGNLSVKQDNNGVDVKDAYGVPVAAYGGDRRPWYITFRGNIFEGKGRIQQVLLLHSMPQNTGTDYAVVVATEELRDQMIARQTADPSVIAQRIAAGMPWYSADARGFIVWETSNVWAEDGTYASCPKWRGACYEGI